MNHERMVFDMEIAPNMVILGMQFEGGGPEHLVIRESISDSVREEIDQRFSRVREAVGYNCAGYDKHILQALMAGADPATCYEISKEIIEGGRKGWQVAKDRQLPSLDYRFLDLMNFCPRGRLKQYESRMGLEIEDLPFDPHAPISDELLPTVVRYLEHDLLATEVLRKELVADINTRRALGEMFGVPDLELRTAAQASGEVIVAEYLKMNPGIEMEDIRHVARMKRNSDHVFRVLPWVREGIRGTIAERIADQIDGSEFSVIDGNRSLMSKEWPKEIQIDEETDLFATLGRGGIHTTDDSNHYSTDSFDVASLYPHILLKPGCAPNHMNEEQFHEIYQAMVTRRLTAKRAGDKVTADALKLALNSTFGAMNFEYSLLYSPLQFIHITVSGQLALIALADRYKKGASQ
jgi:hypothetical protein